MRHWNLTKLYRLLANRVPFLPYLWGIETKIPVCLYLSGGVQFLPYLWGIETYWYHSCFYSCWCFYPTYEALKLLVLIFILLLSLRFYPTYEALKHKICVNDKTFPLRFYPTYEALKLIMNASLLIGLPAFLPYLWGIETRYILYRESFAFLRVFTLPMRHWNIFPLSLACLRFSFLPYLWGIETPKSPTSESYPLCFYPTYEALKQYAEL